MPPKYTRRLDSVELMPGLDLRVWITHRGDVCASPKTHGSSFWPLYETLIAAGAFPPNHPDPHHWMMQHVGSVPTPEDEEAWNAEDNPGWEYNEYAIRCLGWIRLSVSSTCFGGFELTVDYHDQMATRAAFDALIGLARDLIKGRDDVEFVLNSEQPMRGNEGLRELREERNTAPLEPPHPSERSRN